MEPPDTVERTSTRRSNPSVASWARTPMWKKAARSPPPERARPRVTRGRSGIVVVAMACGPPRDRADRATPRSMLAPRPAPVGVRIHCACVQGDHSVDRLSMPEWSEFTPGV
jgi:hypothetical protein